MDLAAYLERMRAWAPVEGEAGRSITRILATQFVDISTILHELSEAAPRVDAHIRRIERVVPRTPAVAAIHSDYVHTWYALRQGLDSTRRGVRDADAAAISSGREAMLEWRRGLRRIADAIRALQNTPTPD